MARPVIPTRVNGVVIGFVQRQVLWAVMCRPAVSVIELCKELYPYGGSEYAHRCIYMAVYRLNKRLAPEWQITKVRPLVYTLTKGAIQ